MSSSQCLNVLFLCTHNSARSVLGEALASTRHPGRLRGFSAGSTPSGRVHPIARDLALSLGYPDSALRSKSWDEFAAPGAPIMDMIITVCDDAAGEQCPVWPGHPVTAHWGYPDPSQVTGGEAVQREAFQAVLDDMAERLDALVDDALMPGGSRAFVTALEGETP